MLVRTRALSRNRSAIVGVGFGTGILWLMTLTSQVENGQSKSLDCLCHEVLRPVFLHDFMPAHIQCQGELICLMTRLGWLWTVANLHPESQDDKQEMEIHTQKVIETFRKENEAWFGRSDLALEFGHCSHEFGNDKYFFQQIDIAATYFLKCLQEKLRRQLCAGCVSDYWNDFRGYPRTRRRPKWIEIAPIKRSESCFKCV